MRHLKTQHGIDCSAFINTYTTPFDKDIISWYEPFLKSYAIHPDVLGYHNLYCDTVKKNTDLSCFDFVFYIRIDLVLKDLFFQKFKYVKDKIIFSSICWTKDYGHKQYDYPRIADMMMYIPKQHYEVFDYVNTNPSIRPLSHFGYPDLVSAGVQINDIDFMVNTLHDSDSAKDWNPLYYIANRDYCKNWYTKDLLWDAAQHCFIAGDATKYLKNNPDDPYQ